MYLFQLTVEKAKKGDVEAAKKLLRWYCGAIAANTYKDGNPHRKPGGTGTQIDEGILRYFGECFQQILDGVDVEKALGLKHDPNRPPDQSKPERDKDIALEVHKLASKTATRRQPKKPKEVIHSKIGEKYGLSKYAIDKIVGEQKDFVEHSVIADELFKTLFDELEAKTDT